MNCEHELGEKETACADGVCPICLCAKVSELDELRKEANIPVKYYHHDGRVSAVYGTSSIAYVEDLRAQLERVELFLAHNADYDQMTEKEQEWFIENIHKKFYPENY